LHRGDPGVAVPALVVPEQTRLKRRRAGAKAILLGRAAGILNSANAAILFDQRQAGAPQRLQPRDRTRKCDSPRHHQAIAELDDNIGGIGRHDGRRDCLRLNRQHIEKCDKKKRHSGGQQQRATQR
jgi:hypothetical protein